MRRILAASIILLLGCALLIIGIVQKQPNEVYNKARMICTECIGLG
ncbi:MAG: CD1871A family CXXC motif-containing protein [Clostridia bacterium]|nr:CD1871A family CXXC motif-containing protein [Clostridia bacterium]